MPWPLAVAITIESFPELNLEKFGLSESDLGESFSVAKALGLPVNTLREIIEFLLGSYCGSLAVQLTDLVPTVREWFQKKIEVGQVPKPTSEQRKEILLKLGKTESFEKFLHTRYVGKKRFSIEGGDSLIPMMWELVRRGSTQGLEEVVVGMAHRGRLNMLVNFMGKDPSLIFSEMEGRRDEHNSFFDGDVKYHLGYSSDCQLENGKSVHCSLAYNPSHLEAVSPVALGMTRAKQRRRQDTAERKKVIPVLIHGDAAFAGQGVVAETLQLSQLKAYTVGGSIHIVIDNQVGFTTSPVNARSGPYSTDMAKILDCPILHVNGDDVEACTRAMQIAVDFRQEFKRDVVINIICYRRFGHNEGDEPAFTQPLLYDKIKKHPTPFEIYSKKLIAESVISQEDRDKLYTQEIDRLQLAMDSNKTNPLPMKPYVFDGFWKGLRRAKGPEDLFDAVKTQTSVETLNSVAKLLTTFPEGFTVHPKLQKLLQGRSDMMNGEGQIDWGMGELLSYGATLMEGNCIRLTGQDCIRGTFSHRHSCFYDVKTGEMYSPLSTIDPQNVEFCVYDSFLSEYAALGFEYGNSSSDPTFLTIWEAQFGDFANGAQIIIDQFISSAEQKWQRMSGLVMLLPHGYEGQGPEHSSARLERFLQMCAQDNMQVCNLTTPAQLFHVLRRQVKRAFRKPLVIMSPKSLLRHPRVISKISDFTEHGFQSIIPNQIGSAQDTTTALLCSGKIYYELEDAISKTGTENTQLMRVEQLYPFPEAAIQGEFAKLKNLKKVAWVQEEPQNMGAWTSVFFELQKMLKNTGVEIEYIGRTPRASPAVGSEKVHAQEQSLILETAVNFIRTGEEKKSPMRSVKTAAQGKGKS